MLVDRSLSELFILTEFHLCNRALMLVLELANGVRPKDIPVTKMRMTKKIIQNMHRLLLS